MPDRPAAPAPSPPTDPPAGAPSAYATPRAALFGAMREALGAPVLVLAASYLGFGSFARSSDLTFGMAMTSTATGWALPGQIALVELYAVGASLMAIALAVALTNVRLLPMALALMPHLRSPGRPRWHYWAVAHWVAVTCWVHTLRRAPDLPAEQRLPFFLGFSLALWGSTLVATAAGYILAGAVPGYVSLGLVFLNPIYFMLILGADARDRDRARAWAMALGAVIGPALHTFDPDWGLLATGAIAGTAAFAGDRWIAGRRRREGRDG